MEEVPQHIPASATVQHPSETAINETAEIPVARFLSHDVHPDLVQPKFDTKRSYSMPVDSARFKRQTKSSVNQFPRDDDICYLEDVDICLVIPPKLQQLNYPKAEEGHEEDVAKVIRKKFSKLGLEEGSKDILAFLSSDQQQSSYISWQAHIEEAAEEETDDTFWEKVCGGISIT